MTTRPNISSRQTLESVPRVAYWLRALTGPPSHFSRYQVVDDLLHLARCVERDEAVQYLFDSRLVWGFPRPEVVAGTCFAISRARARGGGR